ncbi:MAG: hypothetical protein ACI9SJ_001310 [Flavobacteriaceae bacterium]|jgi:hypothetical protein
MIKFILEFIIYFSIFLSLLYIRSFIRNNKAFKLFTIYLIVISIIQLSSFLIIKSGGESNLFLSHYYFISQFILLSLFFKELLKFKWISWVLYIGLLLIGYQYIIEPNLYFQYNTIGMAITQTFIVIYSLLYFYKSLSGKNEFILVNIGLFFYLLSSTLIFASGNLVFDLSIREQVSRLLNIINAVLYLVFQLLIFVEWWRNHRTIFLKSN